MRKAFYLLASTVLVLPVTVAAQTTNRLPKTVDDVNTLIGGWVSYLIGLFWVAAFLSGLYGAFKFLTAKGDPKAAEQAKKILIYTVVAACVALLATVVENIAKSILEI
jgi:succinate dehydrogenase/fumarate reductase cytochrome b subunit